MVMSPAFWAGRRVFLTGHTGFKGGWLTIWLQELGAEVQGYALPANTSPAFWQVAGLQEKVPGTLADIRDAKRLLCAITSFQPEIVLHLAAQPLVRESYRLPAETYAINVMGTVNLLEAVRLCDSVRAVVVVTTDKCYDNREWVWPYREQDALGGHDPYSSSKACTEILCASWRDAYLRKKGVALATARAGNVFGGGDWAADRLIPDILNTWQAGESLSLRYPDAVRPWQHVLEPLSGYLSLAQALIEQGDTMASAWNFGPDADALVSVGELVEKLSRGWKGEARWKIEPVSQPHESGLLALDSAKARKMLNWRPRWTIDQAVKRTLDWHTAWLTDADMHIFTRGQIAAYQGETDE